MKIKNMALNGPLKEGYYDMIVFPGVTDVKGPNLVWLLVAP